jgi:hypothetical protein
MMEKSADGMPEAVCNIAVGVDSGKYPSTARIAVWNTASSWATLGGVGEIEESR